MRRSVGLGRELSGPIAAFDYLAKGNAQLLNTLRRRFTDGPIDWKALMEKMAAEKK